MEAPIASPTASNPEEPSSTSSSTKSNSKGKRKVGIVSAELFKEKQAEMEQIMAKVKEYRHGPYTVTEIPYAIFCKRPFVLDLPLAVHSANTEQVREFCSQVGLPTFGKKATKTSLLVGLGTRQGMLIALLGGGFTLGRLAKGTKAYVGHMLDMNPDDCSQCFMKGVMQGYIDIYTDDPMNILISTGSCLLSCKNTLEFRVKDVIHQWDYAGTDYECGGEGGAVKCPGCEEGYYLTSMCEGRFQVDSGKGHNHCTRCRNLGQCIGDYRETHCRQCGTHFFGGFCHAYSCPKCRLQRDVSDGEAELREMMIESGEMPPMEEEDMFW